MTNKKHVAIIGAGPAGLAAAEALIDCDCVVTIYDAMPSPARKLLWAGKSGLNLTHAEPFEKFKNRFGNASINLLPALTAFTPTDLQTWADELGAETFVGSSGRVFPKAMKASPLLRNWLKRLDQAGVVLKTKHKWLGYDGEQLRFETPSGELSVAADVTILALGGASYPKLGSNAKWVQWLERRDIKIATFRPSNCGFDVNWSTHFQEKFAGTPVKNVTVLTNAAAIEGEFVIRKSGIEGSLIYTHAAPLRDQLETKGEASLTIDLAPNRVVEKLQLALERQNPKQSLSNRLRKGARLTGAKAALVRELFPEAAKANPEQLAIKIKALNLAVVAPRPIEEAISTAGGIEWSELNENYMLKKQPGTFVAGEMIDWEAPTGGYLLSACFATGRAAGIGAAKWLHQFR
ncbi:TIGR03862 family flavoprotein [Maritalea sp.]|uniref:TIGR03862 family flavoprotein n=1 Tax=Maritalea sp. TaxID=2003361 RepID=UPI003EFA158E